MSARVGSRKLPEKSQVILEREAEIVDAVPQHGQALDAHEPRERPTLATIVEKIGPLRNKTADETPAAPTRERGRRRG